MSRFNHRLPEVPTPQGDLCVPLHIPNHPDYVKLIVRQLRQLTLDRMYERDESHTALIVREQWFERMYVPFLDALETAMGCVDCEAGDCIAYPSSANIISYYPQNPFSEPDLVPSGYLTTPFTRWADFIPLVPDWLQDWFSGAISELTGYEADDIVVDISSLPLLANWQDLLNGVMPQISVQTSGIGIVELHLLNFPLGGRAIITIDTQPNLADIFLGILGNAETSIELNRDLIGLPIESASVVIHEVEITDGLPHTIHITFVPVVDDAAIPILFGGGLRKVVFCGLDGVVMPIVEDIRVTNCGIEKLVNGQWIAAGDLTTCVTGITNPMQAAITANAANIATNAGDIGDNASAIEINEIDIATNALDIADNLLSIQQHELTIQDHETRITALENAGGGGGSGSYDLLTVTVRELIAEVILQTDNQGVSFDIPDGYTDLEAVMFGIADSSGIGSISIRFNNDLANTYYYQDVESGAPSLGANLAWMREETDLSAGGAMATIFIPNIQSLTWKYAFALSGSRGGTYGLIHASRGVQWRNTAPITQVRFELDAGVKMQAGTTWRMYGYREQQVAVPVAPTEFLVDFSATSYAWTEHGGNQGVFSASGGNPAECYILQPTLGTDDIVISIYPNKTGNWTVLQFDYYTDSIAGSAKVYHNGLLLPTTSLPNTQIWSTMDYSGLFSVQFPIAVTSGDEIRVVLYNPGEELNELRLDNIKITIE